MASFTEPTATLRLLFLVTSSSYLGAPEAWRNESPV
jgi:hypothetical protein